MTFGTLAAKGVVRDVGRVLDMPYAKCDSIAKMIPRFGNDTRQGPEGSPDLRELIRRMTKSYLIDMSRKTGGPAAIRSCMPPESSSVRRR